MIDGTYFSENQKNVLGTVETRKNKYGRMEEFVSGSKEEAIKKIEEIGKEYMNKEQEVKTPPVETKTTEKTVVEKAVEKKPKTPRKTEKPREVVSDV